MFDTSTSGKRSSRTLVLSLTLHIAFVLALLTVHFTSDTPVAPVRDIRVSLVAPAAYKVRPLARAKAAPPEPSRTEVVDAPVAAHQTPLPPAPIQPDVPAAVVAEVPVLSPKLPAPVRTGGFADATTAVPHAATPTLVASAGFGGVTAASAPVAQRAAVRSGGFGDAVSAAPSAIRARQASPAAVTVAQILEKPRPLYSEEARRLQIEGEVQLEILFSASGEIRILRVVRGLGHGLDENAAQAARTIRFLPARRDGRPVDSTATVHIIFQLAS